jgi:hypothetical protein
MTKLEELAAAVVAECEPLLEFGPARKTKTSAIMTVFRQYVEGAVTGIQPKLVTGVGDRRQRQWLISLEFWDTEAATRLADSTGRHYDTDHAVTAYGGDVVTGLDAAADLVAEYAAQAVPEYAADFGQETMRRAFAGIRPTLSRQQGHATMRRTSADGKRHLICDIFRDTNFPKEGTDND